jgi:hypothetical protein
MKVASFLLKLTWHSLFDSPRVRPKIIKLLMYFKLAIYVMKVFLKVPKNAFFIAQNVLDSLLSLHIYVFLYA